MSTESSSSAAPPFVPPRPSPPPPPAAAGAAREGTKKSKKANPAELIAMYEAKGLSSTAAAHQAILDLQKVLSKVISEVRTSPTHRNEAFKSDMNTRLAILEMKLDSKPSIGQMLGIQVAGTAIVQTAPHVFRAVGSMWNNVRNSTKP